MHTWTGKVEAGPAIQDLVADPAVVSCVGKGAVATLGRVQSAGRKNSTLEIACLATNKSSSPFCDCAERSPEPVSNIPEPC